MLKPELIEILEELFTIGGNFDRLKSIELKNRLLDFIKAEQLSLDYQDNGNTILSHDVISFIDANNVYAATTNRIEAGIHMQPFFERLINLNDWNYYEIKFLVSSLIFTENVKQALDLGTLATQNLIKFRNINKTDVLEGYLASNICSRILYAKYFDNNIEVDLSEQFDVWFLKLKNLAKKNSVLELTFIATQIRRTLLYQVPEETAELCRKVEVIYTEKIADMIKGEISFYLRSEKYKSNFFKGGEK